MWISNDQNENIKTGHPKMGPDYAPFDLNLIGLIWMDVSKTEKKKDGCT